MHRCNNEHIKHIITTSVSHHCYLATLPRLVISFHLEILVMAAAVRMPSANQPKSMTRPTRWSDVVEEAYRFQVAGYRDEIEYREVQRTDHVDRWPHNGYVKKLVRRDGCFYYYNRTRECPDKEINKTKLYEY